MASNGKSVKTRQKRTSELRSEIKNLDDVKEYVNEDVKVKTEINFTDDKTLIKRQKLQPVNPEVWKESEVHAMPWKSFACTASQLRLDIVLRCGQSFRWTTPFPDRPDEYVGVLGKKVKQFGNVPTTICDTIGNHVGYLHYFPF